MSEYTNRHHALQHALEHARIHFVKDAPIPASEVVRNAQAFEAFLDHGTLAASADASAPAPSTAKTESAPAPSAGAASPKAGRRGAGKSASPAVESSAQTASAATPVQETAAAASPSEPDDLFGNSTAAQPQPATDKSEPVKEAKAEKAKPLTLDDVRAQLVLVQTNCGGKDAVFDLLKKHTTGGVSVISKLPESAFGAIIAEAKGLVAKATTAK